MSKFKNIPQNIKLTNLEEETIKFWKDKKIFEKSVSSRPKDNNYSFYDGPPFITGTPHHGSLLPGIAKDIIPRYWTMTSSNRLVLTFDISYRHPKIY